jgi:hypothetical protein
MVQINFSFCKLFKSYDLLKVVNLKELAIYLLPHTDQPYAYACINYLINEEFGD